MSKSTSKREFEFKEGTPPNPTPFHDPEHSKTELCLNQLQTLNINLKSIRALREGSSLFFHDDRITFFHDEVGGRVHHCPESM
jgi:hypothetical protein